MSEPRACPECKGSGVATVKTHDLPVCFTCRGSGKVTKCPVKPPPDDKVLKEAYGPRWATPHPRSCAGGCHGTGWVPAEDQG